MPIEALKLYQQLGLPRAPMILDVRRTEAWAASELQLPGTLRCAPDEIGDWAKTIPKASTVVVYCIRGHEVGIAAATTLTALGMQADYLAGGIEAWTAAGLPTVTKHPEWQVPAIHAHHSRWITRERPKIDRLACPWLVRRFIDPQASFSLCRPPRCAPRPSR
jgi:rhodanese-related sulfurtransferase